MIDSVRVSLARSQATKFKKLLVFFYFQYHKFEYTVPNFDKDMFRKESFCGTNSYSTLNEYHI